MMFVLEFDAPFNCVLVAGEWHADQCGGDCTLTLSQIFTTTPYWDTFVAYFDQLGVPLSCRVAPAVGGGIAAVNLTAKHATLAALPRYAVSAEGIVTCDEAVLLLTQPIRWRADTPPAPPAVFVRRARRRILPGAVLE